MTSKTAWQILKDSYKQKTTPTELQFHNPLQARIGKTIVRFGDVDDLKDLNLQVESIDVFKTRVNNKDYLSTDYNLSANILKQPKPLRVTLRLIADDDASNELHHKFQILRPYQEQSWDQGFFDYLNAGDQEAEDNGWKTIKCNYDENNVELEEPLKYWRVEQVSDPYQATVTSMADENKDGKIDENELKTRKVTYWDYARTKVDEETKQESPEYLWVEMDKSARYFIIRKGEEVLSTQVSVF